MFFEFKFLVDSRAQPRQTFVSTDWDRESLLNPWIPGLSFRLSVGLRIPGQDCHFDCLWNWESQLRTFISTVFGTENPSSRLSFRLYVRLRLPAQDGYFDCLWDWEYRLRTVCGTENTASGLSGGLRIPAQDVVPGIGGNRKYQLENCLKYFLGKIAEYSKEKGIEPGFMGQCHDI